MATTHPPLDLFKVGLAAGKLPFFTRPGIEHLRNTLNGMTEFRFDDATSTALGELSMQGLEQLGKLLPDIRLPMRACAVTFNVRLATQKAAEAYSEAFSPNVAHPDLETFNKEVCTFIAAHSAVSPELPVIDFFFIDGDDKKAMLFPLIYRFDPDRADHLPMFWGNVHIQSHKQDLMESNKEFMDFSQRLFGGHSTAETVQHVSQLLHMMGRVVLRDAITRDALTAMTDMVHKTGIVLTKDFDKDWATDGIRAGGNLFAGGCRFALAALAMLSMRDTEIIAVDQPSRRPGKIRVGNKTAPYWQHATVRLTVPSVRYLYAVKCRGEKNARRRGHVIGHWVNRGGDRTCAHSWIDVDINHKECARCQRKRYWRKDFDRGNAALGWVQHDRYQVVSPSKQDALLDQVNIVLSHR